MPISAPNPNCPPSEKRVDAVAGRHARDADLELARDVLAQVGRVVQVPEMYLDAVTSISGSGPAYFALLAEA